MLFQARLVLPIQGCIVASIGNKKLKTQRFILRSGIWVLDFGSGKWVVDFGAGVGGSGPYVRVVIEFEAELLEPFRVDRRIDHIRPVHLQSPSLQFMNNYFAEM